MDIYFAQRYSKMARFQKIILKQQQRMEGLKPSIRYTSLIINTLSTLKSKKLLKSRPICKICVEFFLAPNSYFVQARA
jgi:hypothetical protein